MANTGTTTVNFGAFPGSMDCSVAITGQSGIASDSLAEAWMWPIATADHSADEHMIEPIRVIAGNVSAGVGFTIYAFYQGDQGNNAADPPTLVKANNGTGVTPTMRGNQMAFGLFTVAWVWN